MNEYDSVRQQYRPKNIKVLLIAESPPPSSDVQSSRHFYRTDRIRRDDRLFTNTVRAIYPNLQEQTEQQLEEKKEAILRQFESDGFYFIESLPVSMEHEVTKKQRQLNIHDVLPELIKKVQKLADPNTAIILIKSNVFDVAKNPLEAAGFNVLNSELVDYPGRYNQQPYREKLKALLKNIEY